jgi:hypothetical protein
MQWFVIPLVFIAIRSSGIEISNGRLSSRLVDLLSFMFPKIAAEHDLIVSVSNASNGFMYLLFYLSLLLFSIFLFLHIIYDFSKVPPGIVMRPGWTEIKIILLFMPAVFVEVFDNIVTTNPRPIWDFYIDQYGFYYIRKAALFFGISFIIYVILVSILSMTAGGVRR